MPFSILERIVGGETYLGEDGFESAQVVGMAIEAEDWSSCPFAH